MRTFVALLTVRLLNLHFKAEQSWNYDMVTFQNSKGNKIYIKLDNDDTTVEVSVYKVTARCYHVTYAGTMDTLQMEDAIARFATELKDKLRLTTDIKPKD